MERLHALLSLYSGIVLAALAVWIVVRCAVSMLRARYEPEIWGYLELPGGSSRPVNHWEIILGRAVSSDVVLEDPSVARTHASLQRDDSGSWLLTDLADRDDVLLNGKPVSGEASVKNGDRIKLGKVSLRFLSLSDAQRRTLQKNRQEPGKAVNASFTLLLLSVFQAVIVFQLMLSTEAAYRFPVALSFGFLAALEWGAYFVVRSVSVRGFEAETVALFLTTVGFSVAATSTPDGMVKQSVLFLAALAGFFALGVWLRDLRRARALRWVMAFAALGFLALNLLLSEEIWGAKNWLSIAGQSLQPSEFVKIAFVYAGAATLDRLFRRRNLIMFIGFSAVCVGALALMGDFGTAAVFFLCFLVISFLRSGSFATLILALGGAALAVVMVLAVKPYVAARFANWGHAWDAPLGSGYQQVRAMSALASGGLFGRGAGAGWLKDVVAAETDLVFAVVCEELGLIVGFCCVAAILLLALFSVRSAATSRSSYYLIASCATVTIFMAQMALNVFGSLDLLPFTGVTFPFVSRGGSSLISCWIMMAYIKAGDTRQSGSFALRSTFSSVKARRVPAAPKAPAGRPSASAGGGKASVAASKSAAATKAAPGKKASSATAGKASRAAAKPSAGSASSKSSSKSASGSGKGAKK